METKIRKFKINLLLLALMIGFFVATAKASAETYYVDCDASDDNGAGTSEDTAWKTISKVNNSTFNPNDEILFKKDCTWRSLLIIPSSGTVDNPITFGAYGTGENPLISSADDIIGTSGSWTSAGSNVWSRSLPGQTYTVFFNEDQMGTNIANYLNISGQYQWSWSGGRFYVYATSNPSGYYSKIEAGQRNYVVEIKERAYITLSGIHVKYGNHASEGVVKIRDSEYITMEDCIITNPHGTGVKVYNSPHFTMDGCVLVGNDKTQDTSYSCGVKFEAGSTNWEVKNSSLTGFRMGVRTNNSQPGSNNFSVHDNIFSDSGLVGNYDEGAIYTSFVENGEIYNNIISSNSYSVASYSGSNINIHDNTSLVSGSDGIAVNSMTGTNIITRNYIANAGVENSTYAGISIEGTSRGVYASYNLIVNPGHRGLRYYGIIGPASGTFVNNTVIGGQVGMYIGKSTGGVIVKNNLFYDQETAVEKTSAAATPNLDHNLYYPSGRYVWNNATYDFTAYKNIFSQDLHSLENDPMFSDISQSDFGLRGFSPAINAGENVGLSFDYENNSIIEDPDIGAYEYIADTEGSLSKSDFSTKKKLSSKTKNKTIFFKTGKNAICKYATHAGVEYDAMSNFFTITGGTSHSTKISKLKDGKSYKYYVRCQNELLNVDVEDFVVSFSVERKPEKYILKNDPKKAIRGQIMTQSGKKFSKNSFVKLYFSRPSGGFYDPFTVETSSTGSFSVDYKIPWNKPFGKYKWYAIDGKTGTKSEKTSYTVY